ncbi:hypothetical protein HPB49_004330 [Dermacentor silvarum]|uniref:Uncharacterized protein n=1 Tax=Dermacentor silvarum TaxID=543639 RepID=A0ACB8D2S6_DERSI|nr:hypothetical protein HPB49_004330 [Dermacentor silvarum]
MDLPIYQFHCTKTVLEEAPALGVDSRLLHLWEVLHKVRQRYARMKLNRSLRKRSVQIRSTIEDHATYLTQQNWHAICNRMERQPNIPKIWNILRSLLTTKTSKTAQRQDLAGLLHTYTGKDQADRRAGREPWDTALGKDLCRQNSPFCSVLLDRRLAMSKEYAGFYVRRYGDRSAFSTIGFTWYALRWIQ